MLYDGGIGVAAAASFASLVRPGELRVSPQDRDRIGVADGASVRVTSARGQLELPIAADATVPTGVAVLAWNLADQPAGGSWTRRAAVTDVRVESIR